MADNQLMPNDEMDNFYTLVPDQGLCLVDDNIINLRKIVMIRKNEGKTLVHCSGIADPIILPLDLFDKIREAVFMADDLDEDEDDDEM